jgi:hypothetical protein
MTQSNEAHYPDDPEAVVTAQRLMPVRLIAFSLLLGLLVFLGMVLVIVWIQDGGHALKQPPGLPILTYVAVAFVCLNAVVSFLLPAAIAGANLRKICKGEWRPGPGQSMTADASDSVKVFSLYQGSLITGLAPLEGAGFLGGIAYLMEAQSIALGTVGLAILMMLFRFPTTARARTWVRRNVNELNEMRQRVGLE